MLVLKLIEGQGDGPPTERLNKHLGYLDEIERRLASGGQCGTQVAQELVDIARDLIRIYGDCSKRATRGLDAIARDLARIHGRGEKYERAGGSRARGAANAGDAVGAGQLDLSMRDLERAAQEPSAGSTAD
jgi:phage-related minor tail protein